MEEEPNLLASWQQMNELLGSVIIALDEPDADPVEIAPTVLAEKLAYILAHEEVTARGLDRRPGERSDKIQTDPRLGDICLPNHHPKFPYYWLGYSQLKGDLRIDHAQLLRVPNSSPMHRVGTVKGIPVIFYDYYTHSGHTSLIVPDSEGILRKLHEARQKLLATA